MSTQAGQLTHEEAASHSTSSGEDDTFVVLVRIHSRCTSYLRSESGNLKTTLGSGTDRDVHWSTTIRLSDRKMRARGNDKQTTSGGVSTRKHMGTYKRNAYSRAPERTRTHTGREHVEMRVGAGWVRNCRAGVERA